MTFHVPTRADDEDLLKMLALRRNRTAREVGKIYGKSQATIRVMTNNVINADSRAEGRDVRRDYRYMDYSAALRVGMAG